MDRYIAGIGEVLWDCLPEGRKLGGAPANFAWHAGQFGFRSIAVSAVGADSLGDEIKKILCKTGIGNILETVSYPTGTVNVTLDNAGIPKYEIMEEVAWDNIPYTKEMEVIASKCAVACFGSLAQRSEVSRSTIRQFLDAMPSEGTYKLFDINLRQHFYSKDIITDSLTRCNVLKLNDEELPVLQNMFGHEGRSADETCKELISEHDLKILILTCGTEGSYVFTKDEKSFLETPKVDVTDTVGAGDSFTAAFMACILKGMSIMEAHRIAVQISAYVCTQKGAMPMLPDAITRAGFGHTSR